MNVALWTVAGLLAAAFAVTGYMGATQSRSALAARGLSWVNSFTDLQVKGIGVLEILAAIGLILPALVNIAPVLVPLAAVGLVLLMIGAAVTHIRLGEPRHIIVNAVLGAMAAFVAWGRFGPYAF
jgi:hypothetical protein